MASSLTSASSPTSYITERSPGKYGGMQKDYAFQSKRAIEAAKIQISIGVSEGKDITALFHEVLHELASARQRIAADHRTKFSECFGRKRDLSPSPEELARGLKAQFIGAFTLLTGKEYSEYNSLFLDRLRLLSTTYEAFLKPPMKKPKKSWDVLINFQQK